MSNSRRIAAFLLPLALIGCDAETLRQSSLDTHKVCRLYRMGTIPVSLSDTLPIIPFKVNALQSSAIMDTGGIATFISPSQANAAKAHTSFGRGIWIEGIGGHPTFVPLMWANTVQIGDIKWGHGVQLAISGQPNDEPGAVVNVVGMDFLDKFDYDLDFAHHKISVFSTENCVHPEPPWDTTSTGVPLSRVEHDHKVTMPVAFTGDLLEAEFDTGSMTSYLTRAGARKAGVSDAELDRDPLEVLTGVDGNRKIRRHRFAEIAIGEDVLRDFTMDVDDAHYTNLGVDMIIGMDYIAQHHLWLSLSTNALFIDSGERKKSVRG